MPSTRSTELRQSTRWVRTVDDARRFVLDIGVCQIFESGPSHRSGGRKPMPSLWDVVDAPDKQPGERGFGERSALVWRLKNELPMAYPDQVFYGKLSTGRAMLCTLDYLLSIYGRQRRPGDPLSPDALRLLRIIETRPINNHDLRLDAGFHAPEMRARFERALQELQVRFFIARIDVDPDTWFPFEAAYPTLAAP
jgi:hypothetical protein